MGQKIGQFLTNHWFGSLATLLIATVGITYGVVNELIITPKNDRIEELQSKLTETSDELAKYEEMIKDIEHQKSVLTLEVGESVTVYNNEINIRARKITDKEVELYIDSRRSQPQTIVLNSENPQDTIFHGEGKMVVNLLKIEGKEAHINVGEWVD